MKDRLKRFLCFLMATILMVDCMSTLANAATTGTGTGEGIVLADKNGAAPIYIDDEGPAYAGLRLIADAVASDINAITGQTPTVVNEEPESGVMIIAGLVNETIITNEKLTWGIEASGDSFKSEHFERYQIQVKEEDGKTKIIVAGADKRGTIYGLFHITQDLCGVSPWIWWADVKPAQQDTLAFTKAQLEVTSDRPSVSYRGFFLNDENPSLDGFADSHFGGLNYMFYSHVCELMLRLKGNYLWPAMWTNSFNVDGMEGVTGDFATLEEEYHDMLNGVMYIDTHDGVESDVNINSLYGTGIDGDGTGSLKAGEYPMSLANAVIADHYGVMVGASHHEPMARAGAEWGNYKKGYYSTVYEGESGSGSGEWNYLTNPTNISNFWSDAIARNGNFSNNLYTIGMRGENDSALKDSDGNELDTAENAALLENVLVAQNEILNKYSQTNAPRLFCLYKEVETCWYGGKRSDPDAADNTIALREDTTIKTMLGANTNNIVMFCEDNNGYLRTLAEYGDKDDYNYGLYYHFDYVGGPRTSMWINTMPLQRLWDNMTTAYEYGVDDAWIVNVGDLKPMELPLSYFMDMAYDFDTYGSSAINSADDYTKNWVKQQFAAVDLEDDEVEDIAKILTEYANMNGDTKPETLDADTYSVLNYNEAQEHLAEAIELETLANQYLEKYTDTNLYDAYYELVYYPAAATANANKLWVFMALNQLYAERGSMMANMYAALVEEAVDKDRALTEEYNSLGEELNGKNKWYRMMVTAPFAGETVCDKSAHGHLNYTEWNHESSATITPTYVQGSFDSQLIVDVEGDATGYTSGTTAVLPNFYNVNKEQYAVTLSNGGSANLSYEISEVPNWVKINGETVADTLNGSFYVGKVLGVSVDWTLVTENTTGSFKITSGDQSVTVTVNAKVVEIPTEIEESNAKAAVVLDGVVSITADNYTSTEALSDGTEWKVLEDYGKTGSTLKMYPVYTDNYASGNGPWVEYKVYVPKSETEGAYRLTAYFGQSNNISFYEGDHLNVGVQVNGESITTVNSLDFNLSTVRKDDYVAGESSSWSDNIMYAGHTINCGTVTLVQGMNTIRIYGMDQNVMLQKLVLVCGDNAPLTSLAGPDQSYYLGMGDVAQQNLVCYQTGEAMFIPGTILAKDCTNEDATVTGDVLNAVSGTTYTYNVNVTAEAKYLFSVTGSSESSAKATVQIDDRDPLEFTLGETEATIDNETDISLATGKHVVKLTVSSDASIRFIIAEIYDDTQGRLLQVESTGGDEDNAYKAVDRKASSAWKPTESAPTITLDLGEVAYADYFTLSGDLTGVTAYTLEVTEDDENWTTVYSAEGAPVNGSKVYFQGKTAYKGSKWRFSFTGTVTKLSEISLNTYMNWTLEDENKTYTTGGNNPNRDSSDPTKTADGDRIGYPKYRNGFIADTGTNMTVTFDKYAHTMTGVILSGMQDAVDNDSNGVTPTDVLTGTKTPGTYNISYQTEDGTWVELGDMQTGGKVLNYFEFDNGNEVRVRAIKIHVPGWARVMEVEAVQMIDYTINGVDRNNQNWALSANGGTVTSYTSSDGTDATEQAVLNNGTIKAANVSSADRVRFNAPTGNDTRYVEIELAETIQLQTLKIVGQQGGSEAEDPTADTKGFAIAPAEIEYYDGTKWVSAGQLLQDQGSGEKAHNILREFNSFSTAAISDRIRLKYTNIFKDTAQDDYIRLCELEVYGTSADRLLVPEEDVTTVEDGDNWALSSNGGKVTSYRSSDGSGTGTGSEHSKLNDGDRRSNNSNNFKEQYRETFTKPSGTENLYVEIELAKTIELSKLVIVGQTNSTDLVEPDKYTEGFYIAPVTIEYYDGTTWKSAGALTKDDTAWNKQKILRTVTNFEDVISNKIRLKYDSSFTDTIRLCELEVYGTPAERTVLLYSCTTDNSNLTVADLLGGGTVLKGEHTVTAPNKDGYKFMGWYTATITEGVFTGYTGDVRCKTLEYTLDVQEDIALAAVYKAEGNATVIISGSGYTVTVGETATTPDDTYEQELPVGTEVTITVSNTNFLYWKNGSDKIVSQNTSYTFIVSSDITLTMVYKGTQDATALVEFVSYYKQVLSAATYSAADLGTIAINFDDGETGGFTGRSATVATTKTDAYGGSGYSLVVTGRNNAWAGPQLNITNFAPVGTELTVSAYVRNNENYTIKVNMGLLELRDGGQETPWIGGSVEIDPGEWAKLEGTIKVGKNTTDKGYEMESATFYIETNYNEPGQVSASFSIDNVVISKPADESDAIVFPAGPSKLGETFTGWSMNTSDIREAIINGESHITVTPVYTPSSDTCTITVRYPSDSGLGDVVYENQVKGAGLTVTAKAIDGKVFAYWSSQEGGGIDSALSYKQSYFISVAGNQTLYAIYDVEAEVKPVISMTNVYTSISDGKSKLSFEATRSVPEGYEVLETGMLYSITAIDDMTIGAEGVMKSVSSSTSNSGVYILNVNVTGHESDTVYARGYMIVRNIETGEIVTIYTSTQKSASYNELTPSTE